MNIDIAYRIFGLNKDASVDDIKTSYRRLCKVFHPDIAKDDGTKFKNLKSAYDYLLKNHKQIQSKPKVKAKEYKGKRTNIYRMQELYPGKNTVRVPSWILEEGGVVFVMDKNGNEFKLAVPPKLETGQCAVGHYTFILEPYDRER